MTPSKNVIFESNCFGNVDGGQLWDVLDIATNGFGEHVFPEGAFRLLLKAHFNKGHKSKYIYIKVLYFIENINISTFGLTMVTRNGFGKCCKITQKQ